VMGFYVVIDVVNNIVISHELLVPL